MSASLDAVLGALRERIAAAQGARRALRLKGAGTKDFYGETLAGEVLELGAFSGIVDYEPSELVITARCGTALSEIEAALSARDQFLAFEPPAFGADPTIGGVIAAGLSGPRRAYAGAARDFVLGAKLLSADGALLRFGGRVMKNVAGFDVSRLLCGSLGTLGIITEISLKVLPRPRAEETLRLELPAAAAVESFDRWSAAGLAVSGAAWGQGGAWVRLAGPPPAVRAGHVRRGCEGGSAGRPAVCARGAPARSRRRSRRSEARRPRAAAAPTAGRCTRPVRSRTRTATRGPSRGTSRRGWRSPTPWRDPRGGCHRAGRKSGPGVPRRRGQTRRPCCGRRRSRAARGTPRAPAHAVPPHRSRAAR